MANKIVIKADLVNKKCKAEILSVVAKLQGIKSIDIDPEKCTLTVVGDVDPVCLVQSLRNSRFAATIVSVEEDKPKPKKTPAEEACEKACKEKCEKLCKDACCEKACKGKCEKLCKDACCCECESGGCSGYVPNYPYYGYGYGYGYGGVRAPPVAIGYGYCEERTPGCTIQ